MAHKTRKACLIGLIACMVCFIGPAISAAKAEDPPTKQLPQPQALGFSGIYTLREINPNLTGSGVKFGIICRSLTYIDGEPQNDYQPNIEHNCFRNQQFSFHEAGGLPGDISNHSTAICSILLGEDPNAWDPQLGKFYYQGVAPKAEAEVYEFWHFLINNVFTSTAPDVDILTASIGNQFEDWWTRGIDSMAEHYGIIVVAGIGNGTEAYDPPLYPGAGANVIGVGVVDSVSAESFATRLRQFALAYPEHSTFGPTSQGRCKPDIVAPGNCMVADDNEPNHYEATGSWSSYSTPIVAGTIGLLVQQAKQDPNLSAAVSKEGGNCVIKAILMNSATKLPYWHKGKLGKEDDHTVALDCVQGAGLLDAAQAYRQLIAGQNSPGRCGPTGWDSNKLQTDDTAESVYRITIPEPAGKLITATAVWNNHYDTIYPFEALAEKDSNLRLEVWVVDANDPNNDYLLDYSDSSTDNVEHIYCHADANHTNYEIVISNSDTEDPNRPSDTQRYALAWNVGDELNRDSILWHDLNADGTVNELDISILIDNIVASTKSPQGYLMGDINADGAIDVEDLLILLDHVDRQATWLNEGNTIE